MLYLFPQRESFHRLYSYYCQNTPRSEHLREVIGEKNMFFQACQLKLDHKLPLAAYLLKPVQRITKYQLLLKVNVIVLYLNFILVVCTQSLFYFGWCVFFYRIFNYIAQTWILIKNIYDSNNLINNIMPSLQYFRQKSPSHKKYKLFTSNQACKGVQTLLA